jgi:hypothetical protein
MEPFAHASIELILDFIVYPNMPVFLRDTPMIGLGLITSARGLIAGIILEVGLIVGGATVYWKTRKRTGFQAHV